jgi:hypothetical protein
MQLAASSGGGLLARKSIGVLNECGIRCAALVLSTACFPCRGGPLLQRFKSSSWQRFPSDHTFGIEFVFEFG